MSRSSTQAAMQQSGSRGMMARCLAAAAAAGAASRCWCTSAPGGALAPTRGAQALGSGTKAPLLPAAKLTDAQPQGSSVFALAAATIAAVGAAVCKQRPAARRVVTAVAAAASDEGAGPELVSERGVDYKDLQEMLASGDFKAADAETRRLLIVLGGEAAVKRGWVYFSEVKSIPVADMKTLDGLWSFHSKGKFGYAAQRKIWRQCKAQFDKFAEKVSWFTDTWTNRNWPDEFIYKVDAPVGHLPLTNCIRGAQVLEELMEHPAFAKQKATAGSGARKSGLSML